MVAVGVGGCVCRWWWWWWGCGGWGCGGEGGAVAGAAAAEGDFGEPGGARFVEGDGGGGGGGHGGCGGDVEGRLESYSRTAEVAREMCVRLCGGRWLDVVVLWEMCMVFV